MKNKNEDIIEIVDENGEKFEVELVDLINFEDSEYALLTPIDKQEDEDDDYILMKVIQDGDDYSFETIDDNDEFERVSAYIDEIADETDD